MASLAHLCCCLPSSHCVQHPDNERAALALHKQAVCALCEVLLSTHVVLAAATGVHESLAPILSCQVLHIIQINLQMSMSHRGCKVSSDIRIAKRTKVRGLSDAFLATRQKACGHCGLQVQHCIEGGRIRDEWMHLIGDEKALPVPIFKQLLVVCSPQLCILQDLCSQCHIHCE